VPSISKVKWSLENEDMFPQNGGNHTPSDSALWQNRILNSLSCSILTINVSVKKRNLTFTLLLRYLHNTFIH